MIKFMRKLWTDNVVALCGIIVIVSVVAAFAVSSPPAIAQFKNQNGYFNQDATTSLVTLTAAGAGTFNSADLSNGFGKGLQLGINISAKTGTIAVTVAVQGKDVVSQQYYNLCQSASLTAVGFTLMTVYPGTTAAANTDCNVPLPPTWRVQVVSGAGSTPAVTMTVGAGLIK